jgi:hypothetical protein
MMLTELLMPGRLTMNDVQLDARTSRDVAHGIAERLRQALGTEGPFPDRLQNLLDEMRNREKQERPAKGNN